MADTQAALANRNLSFGGTRIKEEGKLAEKRQMQEEDLNRSAQRSLQGNQQQFEREFGSSVLPTLPGIDSLNLSPTGGEPGVRQIDFSRNLEDITRERAQAKELEYQRRRGNRMLPEGYAQTQTTY